MNLLTMRVLNENNFRWLLTWNRKLDKNISTCKNYVEKDRWASGPKHNFFRHSVFKVVSIGMFLKKYDHVKCGFCKYIVTLEKCNSDKLEHFFLQKKVLLYLKYIQVPFSEEKRVQLVRGIFLSSEFLQNPYFSSMASSWIVEGESQNLRLG